MNNETKKKRKREKKMSQVGVKKKLKCGGFFEGKRQGVGEEGKKAKAKGVCGLENRIYIPTNKDDRDPLCCETQKKGGRGAGGST